ncbi:6-phosphofructokinase II [Edwardsiella ictaluri]|uniref:Phosphofructokinase n=1 Tax=Edwardsiella ictaluri (strain 93-146) TaxID=634503 RepID=C5BGX6_EDWI9|nr:6-phosphofructokinase II [Edwardsiella ictaluri]ACR69054.1 phosphofructokinase 2, putative [Edwardsiella ictaluri 93-146]AVZ83846.1 6-phosphofructokinase II [Edwardsiella ictaluri]EKS7763638.1 6-phosphofructokinase II [Edwardsiella ictaluri]EKS7769481.1 6-phosphofructokinase II [Edwardsiella ictaluri]EKS7773100.1 6-phosphofructokinase II [Edwardsiella ictaluri]
MNSVYTLTLSPSLDCSTSTDKIYPEGKLRCSQAIYQPGGGGVNVARAIYRMGGGAVAIYPAGGSTGAYLTTLLLAEGIAVDVVEVQSWTRQNMHINVTATGEQFRFVMPGADLTPREFDLLTQRLDQIPADAFLVVSGSLPESITPQRFAALLQYVCQRGIRCVVDTSGDALMTAVSQGGLALIKPNQKELATLSGRDMTQPASVLQAAHALVLQGVAQYVVVSLGAQGAIAVDRQAWIQVTPPPIKALTTVGAGDSMVAAMTLQLALGGSLSTLAIGGVAAGTAATLRHGTELCQASDVAEIAAYIEAHHPQSHPF